MRLTFGAAVNAIDTFWARNNCYADILFSKSTDLRIRGKIRKTIDRRGSGFSNYYFDTLVNFYDSKPRFLLKEFWFETWTGLKIRQQDGKVSYSQILSKLFVWSLPYLCHRPFDSKRQAMPTPPKNIKQKIIWINPVNLKTF